MLMTQDIALLLSAFWAPQINPVGVGPLRTHPRHGGAGTCPWAPLQMQTLAPPWVPDSVRTVLNNTSGPGIHEECPRFCDLLGVLIDRETETRHISGM